MDIADITPTLLRTPNTGDECDARLVSNDT